MTVHVTAKHISMGRKGGADSCPVALAMTDAFAREGKRKRIITVGWKSWTPPDGKTYEELPQVARDFILELDAGRVGKPFSFEIP